MREILFQISAAAVLTAAVKALIPSAGYEKQFRILISCFFIAVVIKAFSGFGGFSDTGDIFDADMSYNDYSVQVSEQTAEETAAQLRRRIMSELNARDIFPEKIYVGVNISGEANISISEIRLVFRNAPEEDMQRAVSITKELIGGRAAVTAEEM